MIGNADFDGSHPIKIIYFSLDYRMTCNNAYVYEGAAVWLLPYFFRAGPEVHTRQA